MSETRGIFTLYDLIDLETYDEWVDLQEVWVNSQDDSESLRFNDNLVSYNTGYFGGGDAGDNNSVTTMQKVTYASDTIAVIPGAALSSARRGLAATGNLTAGYFGGGGPGPVTTMDKLSYASDTRSTLPASGSLSSERESLAASSARANGAPSSPANIPLNNIV